MMRKNRKLSAENLERRELFSVSPLGIPADGPVEADGSAYYLGQAYSSNNQVMTHPYFAVTGEQHASTSKIPGPGFAGHIDQVFAEQPDANIAQATDEEIIEALNNGTQLTS